MPAKSSQSPARKRRASAGRLLTSAAATDRLPDDYSVRVKFQGLQISHFNGYYEVGIFNKFPQEHPLRVKVSEYPEGDETAAEEIYSYSPGGDLAESPDLRLDVFGPRAGFEQVLRYEPGKFDRRKGSPDARDFRWVVNYENEELYDAIVRKRPALLRPRLRLTGGVLYTLVITEGEFERVGNGETVNFGRFSYITAANIYFADEASYASLTVGAHEFRLRPRKGFRHDVLVNNECLSPSPGQNDLSLLHEAFEPPDGMGYYFIQPAASGSQIVIASSRQNPCGQIYLGLSPSLDFPVA
jgi:hypothetical protein